MLNITFVKAACGRMDELGETIPLMASLKRLRRLHLSQLIKSEHALNTLAGGLNAFNSRRAAHNLLRLVRLQRRHKPAGAEPPPKRPPILPPGPFKVDARHGCALLVFVPRSLESRLIDDATGGYGYSHVTIDIGEVDQHSGKHVMTEATTSGVVHRSFQDRYGSRPYIRIPLKPAGVDCAAFRECVNSKLGEPYDAKEALTWGAVDDPAKQICSDLAADCLPRELCDAIADARRSHALHRHSVSIHHHGLKPANIFVSPNGFAQFFGAPYGGEVTRTNQLIRVNYKIRSRRSVIPLIMLTALLGMGIVWLLNNRVRVFRE
jgi:hypothetical protein